MDLIGLIYVHKCQLRGVFLMFESIKPYSFMILDYKVMISWDFLVGKVCQNVEDKMLKILSKSCKNF